jgi:protein-S-isoprenylcysteine O-methyltransferase Ste14
MTPGLAKWIFVIALLIWGFLRYPYQRRAARIPVRKTARNLTETSLLAAAALGLGVIPVFYVATGFPGFAEHRFVRDFAYAGALVFALALWLFYRAHRDLGRNFPSALTSVRVMSWYRRTYMHAFVHPMYLVFWLWAIAQLLLLPNWFAGLAGILGFGMLYFGRIEQEEKLMLDTFGDEYRAYMNRTARIVPWIY